MIYDVKIEKLDIKFIDIYPSYHFEKGMVNSHNEYEIFTISFTDNDIKKYGYILNSENLDIETIYNYIQEYECDTIQIRKLVYLIDDIKKLKNRMVFENFPNLVQNLKSLRIFLIELHRDITLKKLIG